MALVHAASVKPKVELTREQYLKIELAHHCIDYIASHPDKKNCTTAGVAILKALGVKINIDAKGKIIKSDASINYLELALNSTIEADKLTFLVTQQISTAKEDDGRMWGSSFHKDLNSDLQRYYERKDRVVADQKEPEAVTAKTESTVPAAQLEALQKALTEREQKISELADNLTEAKRELTTAQTKIGVLEQAQQQAASLEGSRAAEIRALQEQRIKDVGDIAGLGAQLKAAQEAKAELQVRFSALEGAAREQKASTAVSTVPREELEAAKRSLAERDQKVEGLTKTLGEAQQQLAVAQAKNQILEESQRRAASSEESRAAEAKALQQQHERDAAELASLRAQLEAAQNTNAKVEEERRKQAEELRKQAEELQTAKSQLATQTEKVVGLQGELANLRKSAPSIMGDFGRTPSFSGGSRPGSIAGGDGSRTASIAGEQKSKYNQYKEGFEKVTSPFRGYVFDTILKKHTNLVDDPGKGHKREWKAETPEFVQALFKALIRDTFDKYDQPLNTKAWLEQNFTETQATESKLTDLRTALLNPTGSNEVDTVASIKDKRGASIRYFLHKMPLEGYYFPMDDELGNELWKKYETESKQAPASKQAGANGAMPPPPSRTPAQFSSALSVGRLERSASASEQLSRSGAAPAKNGLPPMAPAKHGRVSSVQLKS